jgi:hypothetical protein
VTDTGLHVFLNVFNDVLRGGAGLKDLLNPILLQSQNVIGGDNASSDDVDITGSLLLEDLNHFREKMVMGSGEAGETDDVHVFLDRRDCNLFGGLPNPRIDDFHAGVSQGSDNHLDAPIMTIQPRLCDEYSNLPHACLQEEFGVI